MHEELGVAELKRRFSELLSRVELNHERIAVLKRGRPVAALVPIDDVAANGDAPGQRRMGLTAATGLWEGFQEVDLFLASVRADLDEPMDGPDR